MKLNPPFIITARLMAGVKVGNDFISIEPVRADESGRIKYKAIIEHCDPEWWVLENPVGRINSLVPELEKWGPRYFHPSDYGGWLNPPGDHYTKKTGLWGMFTMPDKKKVEPVMLTNSKGNRGSWMWLKLGGKSERTKELRSATPMGFARAFFEFNP